MAKLKTPQEFISENYLEHEFDIEFDPDLGDGSRPSTKGYIRKDGSYRKVEFSEILDEYGAHIQKEMRSEVLAAMSEREALRKQLADAVRAVEQASQNNNVSRSKMAELRKRVKDTETALQKILDDASTLVDFNDQFKKLRREDAIANALSLKNLIEKQLLQAVKDVDTERPATANHRAKVAEIKRQLSEVTNLLKSLNEDEVKK